MVGRMAYLCMKIRSQVIISTAYHEYVLKGFDLGEVRSPCRILIKRYFCNY
jgi:hypothetical protein